MITASSLVVASMIGTGIFTTSGLLADLLPSPPWVLACWLAGGLVALSGALCYAELSTRMPEQGGEYLYLSRLFHPALGFLSGWTSLVVGFAAPIAAAAMAFSSYAASSAPGLVQGSGRIWGEKALAVVVIILFSALHALAVRIGGAVQSALTVTKIAVVLALPTVGLLAGESPGPGFLFSAAHESADGRSLATAMLLVMFSYSGWNASTYLAGEVRRPRTTLPVSLIAGTAMVMILYLAVNALVLSAVPYELIKGNVTAIQMAATWSLGHGAAEVVGLLIGASLLSSLSAMTMTGPRIYYAMARDGLFFRFAGAVRADHGVPALSVVLQGTVACGMVLAGRFEQILVYLGYALGLFPLLAVSGLFVARRRQIGEESAARVWGYPLVPVFFIASNLAMLILAWARCPRESGAALATVALGLPFYFVWRSSRLSSPSWLCRRSGQASRKPTPSRGWRLRTSAPSSPEELRSPGSVRCDDAPDPPT